MGGGGGGGPGPRGRPQARGASLVLHRDGLLELGLRDGGLLARVRVRVRARARARANPDPDPDPDPNLLGEGKREQPLVYAARGLHV